MSSFEDLVNDFHDHFTSDPNERIVKGIDRDLGELPDPGLDAAEARRSRAQRLLERAEAIDAESLGFDERLDLELARLMLGFDVHRLSYTFNGRTQLQQMPRAGDEVGDGIFLLMANDPRPESQRLADITSRVEKIPEYLEAMLARLEVPVARWVKMDVEKVESLPSLLGAAIEMAEGAGWSDAPRLRSAADAAREAFEGYRGRLGEIETTTSMHLDEADARRLVKLRGIEQSFEELHQIARDFLDETSDQLEALRDRLAPKYGLAADAPLAELHRTLEERFAVEPEPGASAAEAVLGRYAAEKDKVLEFIAARQLFPILEDQEMRILATPTFLEPSIPAGAMMPPPPFREGTHTSLIYLTIKDDRLADHTELGIPSMMIHEGIPGHHLQLATASTHPSVVRRHVDASEQAEGWTTMLEDYMLDLGYMGELTDEARFVGKRDLARIGARVVIDLFFMTGERDFLDVGRAAAGADISGDAFSAAGAVLAAVTGFSPGRVEGELNWYSQERGYPLCYLTGNRMVWGFKRAAAEGPSGLSGLELDRRFHRAYLEAGNMPLSFLRRVLVHDGLIAEGAA